MPDPQVLDIKVIYDASSGRRAAPMRSVRPVRARGGALAVVLGGASVIVSGLLYYGTWWKADPELYLRLMMHTPVQGLDPGAIWILADSQADERSPENVPRLQPKPPLTQELETAPSPRAEQRRLLPRIDALTVESEPVNGSTPEVKGFSASTIQILLPAAAYGWLALATLSACGVAMAGVAALVRAGDFDLRRIGFILCGGVLLGLAWGVASTWADYGLEYKPYRLRWGMIFPVVFAACLGLVFSARARRLSRAAGIALIVAAGGSVAALWLGRRCDAVDAAQATLPILALVFVGHSLWGWVLLFLGGRWIR